MPLAPMPQAPAPQHNAHPYSDQDYTKGQSSFPKFWQPYTVRDVTAAEPDQLSAHRLDRSETARCTCR